MSLLTLDPDNMLIAGGAYLFIFGATAFVLVDAFIVRITLVPALMTVAGRANWWAPAPVLRFLDRLPGHDEATEPEIDLRFPKLPEHS